MQLWSYTNPFQENGDELCDVISIFGDHVFIFFDREKVLENFGPDEDPRVRWQRWKRKAIDRQIATAHGAERYLRSGGAIYLDARKTRRLAIKVNLQSLVVHKIIVAHGAADACKNFSEENIYGSLAISYGVPFEGEGAHIPFLIHLDRDNPVHVFDSHNLPIILGELDTVTDFSNYLDAKVEAIRRFETLSYDGEEDLLAHYFLNTDESTNRHFIGALDQPLNGLWIMQGSWKGLTEHEIYTTTKAANGISYLWDKLIDKTANHWLRGESLGDADLLSRPSAIFEMAKEPRFMRRSHAEHMMEAVEQFSPGEGLSRHMRYFASNDREKGYVFLQLAVPEDWRRDEVAYRAKRQAILRIACGAAKNYFPDLTIVVGLAIESLKSREDMGEDFLLLNCSTWNEEQRQEIIDVNHDWGFFTSVAVQERTSSEFISSSHGQTGGRDRRPGRNQLCPCGSGRKFKRCHGNLR